MTSSQRIAVNTLATYGRSVLCMFLGLFSSRWVLQALGQQDFGLYSVVGSVIVFITFLNGVTSGSVARFLAYSIGKGEPEETCKWFNTALFLHTVIPFCLLLVGWPLGEKAVYHFLNIPADRLQACVWVFRLSLLSAFVSMVSTPYIGMHVAKQKIAELAVWNMLGSLSTFGLAYGLTRYHGDALLFYASGVVAVSGVMQMIQVFRAKRMFTECRVRCAYLWNSRRVRDILAYAGWWIFGAGGDLFRLQGTAVLLNKFFNPASFPSVNAAYGIGFAVSGQCQMLSSALFGALLPEITSSEGRGDRQRVLIYAMRASKYTTFLLLVFAVPLFIEMDAALALWLKTPPEMASVFCRMMLVTLIIDKLTLGELAAISAQGQIAGYQIVSGCFLIATLFLSWMFLYFGGGPTSIVWSFIMTITGCSLARVFYANKLIGASVRAWCSGVLSPCLAVAVFAFALGTGIQKVIPVTGVWRMVIVAGCVACVVMGTGWIVIVSRQDRLDVFNTMHRLALRMGIVVG